MVVMFWIQIRFITFISYPRFSSSYEATKIIQWIEWNYSFNQIWIPLDSLLEFQIQQSFSWWSRCLHCLRIQIQVIEKNSISTENAILIKFRDLQCLTKLSWIIPQHQPRKMRSGLHWAHPKLWRGRLHTKPSCNGWSNKAMITPFDQLSPVAIW